MLSAAREASLRHGNGGKQGELVNRTKGFVNLNRFKSGRAIKRLSKFTDDKHKVGLERRKQEGKK